MILIATLIIAISISMDAFSLSLIYGTLNLSSKKIRQLSLMVGAFHFFMPLIGLFIGEYLINKLHLPSHIVLAVIFGFIGIEMISASFKRRDELFLLDFKGLILFSFTVSIDSFSIGAGINVFSNNYFMSSLIFFVTSALFTNIGLKLGKNINDKIGSISTFIGGIILLLFGLLSLLFL